jgi:hypothetical protein
VLGRKAWRLDDVRDHLDQITLKGWVGEGGTPDTLIQDSSLAALLTPDYWLDVLTERGLIAPGTVLISGTVAMTHGVNQFARSWKGEMTDPVTGASVDAQYVVEQMPEPIGCFMRCCNAETNEGGRFPPSSVLREDASLGSFDGPVRGVSILGPAADEQSAFAHSELLQNQQVVAGGHPGSAVCNGVLGGDDAHTLEILA